MRRWSSAREASVSSGTVASAAKSDLEWVSVESIRPEYHSGTFLRDSAG
jgi:hypothetical protein